MKWYKSRAAAAMATAAVLIAFVIYALVAGLQSQMERAATENVREIVQIIEAGVTEIRRNDVDTAARLANLFIPEEDAASALERLQKNSPFARLAFAPAGAEAGVCSGGGDYPLAELPFRDRPQGGAPAVSEVYLSNMGAWTYTVRCPVYSGGAPAGEFYADVLMERYDNILPDSIFQGNGLVYLLDAETRRFIYEPTSTEVFISSKYDLHGFFSDFGILDGELEQSISDAIAEKQSIIARMWIDGASSYVYFWPVDQGEWYLCGIIPERSIQGEGEAVTRTVAVASILIFSAAVVSFGFYYWYSRKNQRARQDQIDLFNGIAKTINDVVLLYDCSTGALEFAFDNAERILGVEGGRLSALAKEGSACGENARLARLLRPETFQTGREISEKITWENPATGTGQCLRVETSYISLNGSQKCILSIFDLTREERMQESLRAAALAAQNASRVKSDFLSQMSHEIRTPMNAVLGMAQIAGTKLDDRERMKDCLQKIESSSKHLLGLINDILDISKIESQKVSLSESWFGLDGLLSDLNDILSVQAGAKSQQFTIYNRAGAVELLADRGRLSQVLVNLLNNAVKYTPEGGRVELTAELSEAKLRGRCRLQFQVRDDGIGMSAEFQQKLFSPFEREEDQAVRSQTGTGLGLAIVQSLVSLMGGTVRVESAKGAGTAFFVDVDLRCKTAEEAKPSEASAAADACELGGARILLAEDNAINREIAVEFLEMVHAQVECAVDGVDAFEKFRDSAPGHFAMILMDMQMPRWDGLEATRQIRMLDRPDAGTVPILAVTANAYFEDEQKCREAGMDDHIAKPLELRVFYQKVKQYLPSVAEGGGV